MPLKTTCIGAYPKPAYVPISDWFATGHDQDGYASDVQRRWEDNQTNEARALMDRATAEVVRDQIACGIDIPTDGEVRRENYIHYMCRHFGGFDFDNLTHRVLRGGAYESDLPTIRGPVRAQANSPLARDWQVAQAASDRPVKITLPGPMTISDTTANTHYKDAASQCGDLADALNTEVLALAGAGCKFIQIDEPVFARKPAEALDYGIETLARCFAGLPGDVTRVMHMCCGYPDRLDATEYPKADPAAYLQIAAAVDGVADQISIEDAHRHNPAELFAQFQKSSLIVGFIRIADSRLESVDDIRARMQAVLDLAPPERLIAAPDCGLGFLGRDLAMAKLKNLTAAARQV